MTMILDGSNGLTMPTWTTANRPTTPIIGAQGYNTTYGGVEVYNGSAWDLITGGPAFSAYSTTAISISNNSFTKVTFDTKEFDTNTCYSTSTGRFTPTVAGYYQINSNVGCSSSAERGLSIYKNGSQYKNGMDVSGWSASISTVMYLNGTTDYIEMYFYQASGSTQTTYAGAAQSFFSASYIRGQ